MDSHQIKVLEMVAAGTLSVNDGDRLLQRLKDGKSEASENTHLDRLNGSARNDPQVIRSESTYRQDRTPRPPKFLRVVIKSDDGDKVNIRVPLGLVRTGIRFSALIPERVRRILDKKGLRIEGLKDMDPEDMAKALSELALDVESGDGDNIRIFCE